MFSSTRKTRTNPARRTHGALAVTLVCCLGISAGTLRAQQLSVTIENTLEDGSFSLTPFWVALHSGEFDVWSGGELAADFPGLEAIAEEGNTQPLSDAFSMSPSGSAGGVQATVAAEAAPPPVFSPGESARYVMAVGDRAVNRYFSYASMVIPSNDLFVATSVPTTHEVFDADGTYQGPLTIEIFGRDVVDAGTELNDIAGGAAFSANGGDATDEMSPLAELYANDPDAGYLQSIVGTETATGQTVASFFGPDDLVARITIEVVPVQPLTVTIENTLEDGSFSLTPFWVALHSGEFDVWSGGELAADFPGLEAIAEEGNTQPLSDAFSMSPSGSAGGVQATVAAEAAPPPVFSPGESARYVMAVGDRAVNRYFSYASMVIPSNDLFVATSVPTTHEVFDADGTYQGPLTIEIFGRDVVDAGTELNDITGGAAFSANGGDATDEMSPLADLYANDPDAGYLQSIVGTETATGQTVASFFGPDDLVARITISAARDFRRGDANSDARIDISDGIFLLGWMFHGMDAPGCLEAADINDDDALDLTDAMFVFNYLFAGTAAPPPPGPESCGQPEQFTFGCDLQDACDDAVP